MLRQLFSPRLAGRSAFCSARGLGGRLLAGPSPCARPVPCPAALGVTVRHRWVGVDEDTTAEEAMEWIEQVTEVDGYERHLQEKMFYIKPTKQRQERYNRWVRRRSTDKIKSLLANINYEQAKRAQAHQEHNRQLAAIFSRSTKAKKTPVAEKPGRPANSPAEKQSRPAGLR